MGGSLIFDAVAHAYYRDGVRLPGVTQILRAAGLSGSMEWVTEHALERGREVHKAIELYLRGESDAYEFDPVVVPRLEAFRDWRETLGSRLEILEIETPRAHETLGFGGTPDLLAMLDGVRTVCEWKNGTEQAANKWQAAGYALLTGATGRIGVYLTGEGKFRMQTWTVRADAGVFLSALTCWQARAAHGLLPKEV